MYLGIDFDKLAIALPTHKVSSSPPDKIQWSTGAKFQTASTVVDR